jgi:hypothetical protein
MEAIDKDMAFHDEITSVFKSRQFHMTTSNTETWEATLDGDRVKMKIAHQARLSRVECCNLLILFFNPLSVESH